MRLRDISFNNLKRRKGKAFFLLAGLTTGVATVVALTTISLTMGHNIEEKLDRFGANIVISPQTEGFSLSYGGISLGGVSYQARELTAGDIAGIDRIKNRGNIKVIAPKTLGVVKAASSQVLLAGIDVEKELELKQWWQVTGTAPKADDEVMAGARVAADLGLKPGSSVAVNGREMQVVGILAPTGGQDDELLFARAAAAQAMLGKEGRYSIVEVSALCKDCPVDDIVAQISSEIPGARVSAVQQVVKAKMQALGHLLAITAGVTGVVVVTGILIVLVSMIGSVRERTREIGIFRAIGFRSSHIVRVILTEAAVVSVAAGVVGWGIGLGAAKFALPFFAGEGGLALAVDPVLAGGAVAGALLTGLLASLYPALTAVRLAPNEALRILA